MTPPDALITVPVIMRASSDARKERRQDDNLDRGQLDVTVREMRGALRLQALER